MIQESTASTAVSAVDLKDAYRTMRLIRTFEEQVRLEFAHGNIPGFVHLYAGEEAVAAGVCAHLREDDWIASTHRGHGHAIAKGCDIDGMMAELFGRSTGLCRGKGGSMHIADFSVGMLGANAIVGGGPPLACGAALTAQQLGTDQVAVSFTGDGGSNQGTFLESLNLAAVWNLPCVFVIENNGYGEATASAVHQKVADVADRAHGFGIPGITVDGQDFMAVYDAAGSAVARARAGDGPTLLECKTIRYYGHYEGDSQNYRAAGEVDAVRNGRDCLDILEKHIIDAGSVDVAELRAIDAEVDDRVKHAVKAATDGPQPDVGTLLTDVYVSY